MVGDPKLRVLVVEDVDINLELTELVFRQHGFEVVSATTGAQALEALAGGPVDVIALDIRLPDVDGLALARRLKADPRTSGIPIVAITALAMRGDEERALAAGCDLYITKPIDTRTLGDTVRALVARKRETPDTGS